MRYPVSVTFNQPTIEILLELEALCGSAVAPYINRVELALDFLTETTSGAEQLQHRLGSMIYKKWERNAAFASGGTLYIGRGTGRSQIVLYSDRRSKIQRGRSCAHLEYRVRTVSKVREIGIRTIRDLVEFDHQLFWQERLQLFEIDRARLGKLLTRRHLNSRDRISGRGHNRDIATANLVLRQISYDWPSPTTLRNTALALRDYGIKNLLTALVPVHVSCVVPWPAQLAWPEPL